MGREVSLEHNKVYEVKDLSGLKGVRMELTPFRFRVIDSEKLNIEAVEGDKPKLILPAIPAGFVLEITVQRGRVDIECGSIGKNAQVRVQHVQFVPNPMYAAPPSVAEGSPEFIVKGDVAEGAKIETRVNITAGRVEKGASIAAGPGVTIYVTSSAGKLTSHTSNVTCGIVEETAEITIRQLGKLITAECSEKAKLSLGPKCECVASDAHEPVQDAAHAGDAADEALTSPSKQEAAPGAVSATL